MSGASWRCVLVSDFNVLNLGAHLENDGEAPAVEAVAAPYGQVAAALMVPGAECWRGEPDAAVVWTRPEAVVPAFAQVLAFRPVPLETLLQQVDDFAAALRCAAERLPAVLVPSWTVPPADRGRGLLDRKPGLGVADALARMNLRLAEALAPAPNAFVLDAARWLAAAGRNACSPKLWFMGKVPFGSEVFAEAARDIKAAARALRGEARKLLVLDLDDTLWGGLVGEAGWESLRLGGHDPVGEAFADFQRALSGLAARGVVLGIASKNDEATALAAIDRHPEMRLRRQDFAGWRINWADKAANVAELAAELRLGLQSVVFIDDQPAERARVREALPEVLVPEWPADPLLFTSALQALRCFDAPAVSQEDSRRTALYAAERARAAERRQVGDLDAWLRGLGIAVRVEEVGGANLPRVVQLLNKTNQMNLATRRLTEAELRAWAAGEGHRAWAFRVSDRFGDAGLTGVASLSLADGRATVVDFVLSCRVLGRRVEEAMLAWLVRCARSAGARELRAQLVPTPRNGPCLDFWRRSGLAAEGETRFSWTTSDEYPAPEAVALEASPAEAVPC
jgi:FkbH-like protein